VSDEGHQFNLRFALRAYETTDSARLAHLLLEIGEPVVTREEIKRRWALWRPQDVKGTGGMSISSRVKRGLTLQCTVGILDRRDRQVIVLDPERLAMVARNLPILQNAGGLSLPPSQWSRRPEAPPDLHVIQAQLEMTRTASAR
jgi:hypothetical protein